MGATLSASDARGALRSPGTRLSRVVLWVAGAVVLGAACGAIWAAAIPADREVIGLVRVASVEGKPVVDPANYASAARGLAFSTQVAARMTPADSPWHFWRSFEVQAEGDAFAVRVRTPDVAVNRQIASAVVAQIIDDQRRLFEPQLRTVDSEEQDLRTRLLDAEKDIAALRDLVRSPRTPEIELATMLVRTRILERERELQTWRDKLGDLAKYRAQTRPAVQIGNLQERPFSGRSRFLMSLSIGAIAGMLLSIALLLGRAALRAGLSDANLRA